MPPAANETDDVLLVSGTTYPVWSPYDSFDAAAVLLAALALDKAMQEQRIHESEK